MAADYWLKGVFFGTPFLCKKKEGKNVLDKPNEWYRVRFVNALFILLLISNITTIMDLSSLKWFPLTGCIILWLVLFILMLFVPWETPKQKSTWYGQVIKWIIAVQLVLQFPFNVSAEPVDFIKSLGYLAIAIELELLLLWVGTVILMKVPLKKFIPMQEIAIFGYGIILSLSSVIHVLILAIV